MAEFIDWYQLYPRKMAKKDAEKAWKRLTAQDQDAALKALPNHINYWKNSQTTIQFIAYPATWLNQQRWEDELVIEDAVPEKAIPWWQTNDGILKKAQEIGIHPYAGEDWGALKKRIVDSIKVKI